MKIPPPDRLLPHCIPVETYQGFCHQFSQILTELEISTWFFKCHFCFRRMLTTIVQCLKKYLHCRHTSLSSNLLLYHGKIVPILSNADFRYRQSPQTFLSYLIWYLALVWCTVHLSLIRGPQGMCCQFSENIARQESRHLPRNLENIRFIIYNVYK